MQSEHSQPRPRPGRRALRWVGFTLIGLIGLVVVLVTAVYALSEIRIRHAFDVPGKDITFVSDSATVAWGAHVAGIRGCNDCHNADYGGKVFIDDPALGFITSSNLTSGRGGIGATYTAADWDRAIRHGVRPDGRGLLIMPSMEYAHLSDDDLTALVAYLRSLPPVDRELEKDRVGPLGRALYLAGILPIINADIIDHTSHPAAPHPGPTAEYGAYLSASCQGCHQPNLTGGPIPVPGAPMAANLTPDPETGLGRWTEDDFKRALREGLRPDGTQIDPFMPIPMTSQLNDDEVTAIWQYLRTLPPTATAKTGD